MRKAFDAQVVFFGEVINLLDCRIDLHYAVGHFIHAVFQAECQAVEFVHLFKDAAFMASRKTCLRQIPPDKNNMTFTTDEFCESKSAGGRTLLGIVHHIMPRMSAPRIVQKPDSC